ncbi:hypothetical protein [Bifidobacterium sp. SO4]|uniref:hypothetical protein n=1 Tax=Bifidobacterium sp. SO4 TaxID=2809030 RepID=UPI001BDDB107|nr:hypothetical protein [Bifidobacterium sp. SO4]MBT1170736.1 hypothetical protein [Bifidobacterium sp. SO4]
MVVVLFMSVLDVLSGASLYRRSGGFVGVSEWNRYLGMRRFRARETSGPVIRGMLVGPVFAVIANWRVRFVIAVMPK